MFDEAFGGFMGFEVTPADARHGTELYSSLETLPRAHRRYVMVPNATCRNGHPKTTAGPCFTCSIERKKKRRESREAVGERS
jgi:hypothetical protein